MKNLIITIFLLAIIMSCRQQQKYQSEKCDSYEIISSTDKLKISDTLPGFYPIGKNQMSFKDLNKKQLLIFFKKEMITTTSFYNDEITYKGLDRLIALNNIDFIALSEYKIANYYGVKHNEHGLINSFLFIADENHVIQKIYKDICEENIIEILNKIHTSSNKK